MNISVLLNFISIDSILVMLSYTIHDTRTIPNYPILRKKIKKILSVYIIEDVGAQKNLIKKMRSFIF